MLITDLGEEIILSLKANKSRSLLTILGIVIGIASVIAMISVGQGATQNISSSIQSLGTNLLVVTPGNQKQAGNLVRGGMGSATTLTIEDSDAIKNSIENVNAVAPTVSSRKQILYKGQNTNTSIYGVDENYFTIKNITAEIGTLFNTQQITGYAKVVVFGPTTRNTLFGEDFDPTGIKIKLNGQEYTVIGVTEAKGGTGMGSSDDLVYIPITTAQKYLSGNDKVSNISIEVDKQENMTLAQNEIQLLLLERHRIVDETMADFSIMNQADMLSAMSNVAGTMTLLLGAIAGISLIVGGIGIMNMMLTSVTERTREIGLRKSLGAKNSDISRQFLAESITLTFVGGIIGIIIGTLTSKIISHFGDLTTYVTTWSILFSFGISAIIGIVFGFYPATRAAKMNPIEALRYE
ncbi:MAG: ABC transporter permease [Patescibacteria group bacterium]